MVRRQGRLEKVSSVYRVREIRFQDKEETAVTIPWGDVSTAYHSTGIPEIEFYAAIGTGALRFLRLKKFLRPVLASRRIKAVLMKLVEAKVHGPSREERENARTVLWGQVTNAAGKSVELRLECPQGYQLTVDSSLRAVERVLGGAVAPGAMTPSRAFGEDFALTLDDVRLIE